MIISATSLQEKVRVMDELQQPTQPPSILFYNLCLMYNFTYQSLKKLAETAGVPRSTVDAMFLGNAVRRAEAEKVLEAFSALVHQAWTFESVKVLLLPTFADLHTQHQFDIERLATSAGVPYATLDLMRSGDLVTREEAHLVLQTVSRLTGKQYTLETVDVPLVEERGSG
jgi:hypothetical protein